MKRENFIYKNESLTQQRNVLSVLMAIMVVSNLFLAFKLATQEITTVTLPSQISGVYKLKGKTVNDIYLSDRANEIVKVILNVTPSNLENMHQNILKAVPPSYHFQIKKELKKLSEEVVGRNVSTAFFPISTKVDTHNLTAKISGELYTFFGSSFLEKKKTFFLRFIYTGNQLSLLEFFEEKENENE